MADKWVIIALAVACFAFFLNITAIEKETYGEMYNKTSAGFTFNATQSSVYYNFTGMVCNHFNNVLCTITPKLNYFTILTPGVYTASSQISGEGLAAGGTYGVSIAKNFDEKLSRECYANVDGTSAADVVTITCILNLNRGDTVSLKVEDEASPTKVFTVYTANLNIVKI